MVKVALKEIDFGAVRRIAYIAAISAPLVLVAACSQEKSGGDVSGTANPTPAAPAATPESSGQSQEAAPPAEQPAPPASDQSSGGDTGAAAPAPDSGSSNSSQ
jgi:hypothetical protein